MQTQTVNALSYCFNLLVFIFNNKEAGDKIKSIYLFGSAVRGELHNKSDIDLFVECEPKHEERVKKLVDSGMVKFQASADLQKWKNLHFIYPFTVHFGKLSEWDLKLSIASEGLIIYSKSTNLNEAQRMALFTINYSPKKSEYIKARRLLFGRDEEQFEHQGIIQKSGGKKISTHVFLVPKEEQSRIINILSKAKIEFSMKEINLLES
ncbi:MAG: nucleotidyltransferase domain-containing protein [Nanoarchaeota archaeon]